MTSNIAQGSNDKYFFCSLLLKHLREANVSSDDSLIQALFRENRHGFQCKASRDTCSGEAHGKQGSIANHLEVPGLHFLHKIYS